MSASSVASGTRRRGPRGGHGTGVLSLVTLLGLLSLALASSILLASPAFASGPRVIEELPICTVAGDQWSPVVSGDSYVWEDTRNGDYDIYGYNVTSGKELRVCLAAGDQTEPEISRGVVVWQDNRNGRTNDDIYGYNLTTGRGFAVCTQDDGQWDPAISRNIVVWQDHRSPADDIYGYNLTTKTEFPICVAAGYQQAPAISGNIVVWEDYRSDLADSGGSSDIYGYNLATGTEFPICTDPGNQCDPQISGNIVVWDDDNLGEGDIYGCSLKTKAKFAVCVTAGDQYAPAVSGNIIVWHDWRNVAADIYGRDLTTGTEFPVCTVAGAQVGPGIAGNTVLWADKRDLVDYDIYRATLADVMTGYVYDGHGAMGVLDNAVQDARIEVTEAGMDEVLDTDYTDKEGKFSLSFDYEPLMEYRVTVTLESKDKRLVMKRDGETVSFARDFSELPKGPDGLKIDCSKVAQIAEASMAKGDIENCASVWHYLQLNRQVAQQITEDLTDRLTVNTFSTEMGGTVGRYDQSENAIYLGEHTMDDDSHPGGPGARADAYPPPWDFMKDRETHEFGHAMMNVIMSGGRFAPPNVANHAGYVNDRSGDSLAEGFAVFWTMFADETAKMGGEPDKYDQWGYLATTNRRLAWSPVNTASPMAAPTGFPDEEFAAAGVLRTLQGVLGGGAAGFLKIAYNLPLDGDMTDLRNNLVASGVAAATIDPVFFGFGFFADWDGDWEHDANEAVGAGNGRECKMLSPAANGPQIVTVPARPERHDIPFDPDSFVVVDLKGVPGAASESWVTVEVEHEDDPAADFSHKVLVRGASGLVFVSLDEAATGAVITATGADGVASADKLSFTAAEWQAARAAATDDVALSQAFRVDRVTVGNPLAPKRMSPAKRYTVSATLKPHHTAGTYPLRIYKYRYVAGTWKASGYVKARAANYSTYTKCSCKVRLPLKGKWRLRAYAPADAFHRAAWSRGYAYVTVR